MKNQLKPKVQGKKKICFAVGGTGGHLFPALTLAEELFLKEPSLRFFFAGARLKGNAFFDKRRFAFEEVMSATPFSRSPFKAALSLFKGIRQSLSLLKRERPELLIGFGSYHSFPLLFAAKLKGIPFILFEADTRPGRVNRLFSRYALFTATAFSHCDQHLKGKAIHVAMPNRHSSAFHALTQEQARERLGLKQNCFTLFVFGGSQGAQAINQHILDTLSAMKRPFQLIHLTGDKKSSALIKNKCDLLGIPCYIQEFDPLMGYLWKAADLIIARSGASTLSEMIDFEVPGILIPYPYASRGHQYDNAQFLEKQVGGGVCLLQEKITVDALLHQIDFCKKQKESFKERLHSYKLNEKKPTLGQLVYETIYH